MCNFAKTRMERGSSLRASGVHLVNIASPYDPRFQRLSTRPGASRCTGQHNTPFPLGVGDCVATAPRGAVVSDRLAYGVQCPAPHVQHRHILSPAAVFQTMASVTDPFSGGEECGVLKETGGQWPPAVRPINRHLNISS